MRGRITAFLLGIFGVLMLAAGPAAAYFATVSAFDSGLVPISQRNLVVIGGVFAALVLGMPGLMLLWMGEVTNSITTNRELLEDQNKALRTLCMSAEDALRGLGLESQTATDAAAEAYGGAPQRGGAEFPAEAEAYDDEDDDLYAADEYRRGQSDPYASDYGDEGYPPARGYAARRSAYDDV